MPDLTAQAQAALARGDYARTLQLTEGADADAALAAVRVRAMSGLGSREAERACAAAVARHPLAAELSYLHALLLLDLGNDAEAAQGAQRAFIARVSEKAVPQDLPLKVVRIDGAAGVRIANLLKEAGLAGSTSEANRKIEEGAVRIDGARVSDRGLTLKAGAEHVLQVGAKRFARIRLEPLA